MVYTLYNPLIIKDVVNGNLANQYIDIQEAINQNHDCARCSEIGSLLSKTQLAIIPLPYTHKKKKH